jgi:hypothetical protein
VNGDHVTGAGEGGGLPVSEARRKPGPTASPGARAVLALGLVLGWASLGRLLLVDGLPHAPWGLDGLPMNGAVAATATVVFVLALGAFLIERRPDLAYDAPLATRGGTGEGTHVSLFAPQDLGAIGLVALFALGTTAMEWQSAPGMGINGATTLPGATLLAWWIARRMRNDGVEAACGVVGACYALAAMSKVYTSGFAWASAGNIALQIATQAWLAPEPLRALRLAVASLPELCSFVGIATLFIEGGAILFVLPRARLPMAALIVAMHLGISALMGLHHYDWMFTALGWAVLGGRVERAGQRRAD